MRITQVLAGQAAPDSHNGRDFRIPRCRRSGADATREDDPLKEFERLVHVTQGSPEKSRDPARAGTAYGTLSMVGGDTDLDQPDTSLTTPAGSLIR